MDKIQENIVKCCGVHSYKDYKLTNESSATTVAPPATTPSNTTSNGTTAAPSPVTVDVKYKVPKSCCADVKSGTCKYDRIITDKTTDTGFYQKVCP